MAEVLYPKYKILDHQWAPAVLVQVKQDNIYIHTHTHVCIEKEILDVVCIQRHIRTIVVIQTRLQYNRC